MTDTEYIVFLLWHLAASIMITQTDYKISQLDSWVVCLLPGWLRRLHMYSFTSTLPGPRAKGTCLHKCKYRAIPQERLMIGDRETVLSFWIVIEHIKIIRGKWGKSKHIEEGNVIYWIWGNLNLQWRLILPSYVTAVCDTYSFSLNVVSKQSRWEFP